MPTILVVDDETYIRKLYKEEFESDGYNVLLAANAKEALEKMANNPADLVILDIELQESSGLDLLRQFRQEFKDAAIVLNSAYTTYKADFQSWLADAYIMKSSDLTDLKHKISDLLAKGKCEH